MAAADTATARRGPTPFAVKAAALILVILAALQVLVASLFVTNHDEITQSIALAMPAASPEALSDRLFATIAEGILVHAMLTLVYAAAAIALRRPGASVRIFVTALALVATLTDTLILGQLPTVLPNEAPISSGELIGGTVLRLLVIALLWLPAPARRWYGGQASPV